MPFPSSRGLHRKKYGLIGVIHVSSMRDAGKSSTIVLSTISSPVPHVTQQDLTVVKTGAQDSSTVHEGTPCE
jgi:hypothetical protein